MNLDAPISFFAEIQGRAEKFRHECEVRMVAAFDTDARRSVYLGGVWDQRGPAAAKRLRTDVWALMNSTGHESEPQQDALAL